MSDPESVVDRIVEQNNAFWEFMHSDGLAREQRMGLLKSAFPNSTALRDEPSANNEANE